MRLFADRTDAGRRLAERLREHPDALAQTSGELVVLGLPRGGVPVAAEVASALRAPLDVLVVRKVGVPWHPELAMAAVGEEGAVVRNDDVIAASGTTPKVLAAAESRERAEVARRAQRFRGGRDVVPLAGRVALIVDDGVATGASMRVACEIARARRARRIIAATPVGAPEAIESLRGVADEIVCLAVPGDFMAVGMHYVDFRQTPDADVEHLMANVDRF
ncbi:phosphoribosyltransferase [Microbacterium sp. NPDC055521]